jgi:hypothetical protein
MPVRRQTTSEGLYLGQVSQAAADKLATQGIQVNRWAKRPAESEPPDVPRDLTEVRDRELMNLYQGLNSWVKYLGVQLAAAEVDESSAERAVTRIEAREGYDFRKVDAKQRAYEDKAYQDAKDAQEAARGYRKMVGALYQNVDHDSFHVSRELTRRTARAPRDGRNV